MEDVKNKTQLSMNFNELKTSEQEQDIQKISKPINTQYKTLNIDNYKNNEKKELLQYIIHSEKSF